jgi:small subunit ribosomal protein S9
MEDEKKKIKPATKRAGMTVRAKKKTAVARASIKKGTGKVTINNITLDAYAQGIVRELIYEPIKLANEVMNEVDIEVNVKGSGFMSQAAAARSAIAKAIVRAKGKKYKELFLAYDRMLLVDDVRKVESKKPLGRKARKRKQASKR